MARKMVKAALGVVLAFWLAGSAYGATIIVDQSGGGNATTIAGGVALAANGDTILVRSGTYVEGWYTVNKAVTIKEDAGAEAIVDGQGTAYAGFNITVDGVRIEGFEIKGCGNGVKSSASFKNVFLKDLNIHNCTSVCISMLGGSAEDCTLASSPYGATYADDATFKGVTFQGLTANALYSCTFTTVEGSTFQGCGSCVRYSSNITVIDSDLLSSTSYGVGNVDNISVSGCRMSGGSCGFVSTTGACVERTLVAHYTCAGFYYSEGSLSSTTFTANNSGISQSEVSIVNSIIYGNTNNLLLFPAPSSIAYSCVPPGLNLNSIANLTPGAGNINADPLFVDAGNDDFRLQAASPCVDTGDPATPIPFGVGAGFRIDMGAFERDHNPGAQHVWIVDKTGAGDSTTIKGAVNLAADSDLILVRSGSYTEDWYTVNKFLAVREDAGAEAVIDGQGTAYAGFNLAADGSEIVGFEIKGCGNGIKSSAAYTKVALKGLYIHNCTSVCISDLAGTAEDCVLSDSPYGASYIQGATLANVTFQYLSSNGVYSGSSSTLIGCTFESCGSCTRYSSDMTFADCEFLSPTYYGMANVDGVEATSCVFSGGGANGYAIRECTDVAASRCLFYGWIAAVSYSDVALENVTITGNGKGTDFVEGTIHNSILVGNTDWDLNPTYTSTALRISYSLLDPTVFDLSLSGGFTRDLLYGGGFEIDAGFNIYYADPKFVDAEGHDYRLLVDAVNPANSSPAIDAGDPATAVPAGSGGGSRVDMGYAEAGIAGVNAALLPKPQGVLKIITAEESVFSPAFVEGTCNAEAQSVIISIGGGDPVAVIRRSPTTWYTNVPLSATSDVHIEVSSTDALGNPVSAGQDLTWVETDIMNGVSEIVIRKGDSLLLTGTSTDPNAATLEIDADGDATVDFTGEPGDTYPHEYSVAGVFTAEAKIRDGSGVVLETESIDIKVVEVELHGPVAILVGFTRDVDVYATPVVSASEDVSYVASDPVTTAVSFKEATEDGAMLELTAKREAGVAYEARINGPSGPIVAFRDEVDEFVWDNTAARLVTILHAQGSNPERGGDAQLTMKPLIPNLIVELNTNSPGVTFDGGLSTLSISTNAFVLQEDGSGTYYYTLYFAPGYDSCCMSREAIQEASRAHVTGKKTGDNGNICEAWIETNKDVVNEGEHYEVAYWTDERNHGTQYEILYLPSNLDKQEGRFTFSCTSAGSIGDDAPAVVEGKDQGFVTYVLKSWNTSASLQVRVIKGEAGKIYIVPDRKAIYLAKAGLPAQTQAFIAYKRGDDGKASEYSNVKWSVDAPLRIEGGDVGARVVVGAEGLTSVEGNVKADDTANGEGNVDATASLIVGLPFRYPYKDLQEAAIYSWVSVADDELTVHAHKGKAYNALITGYERKSFLEVMNGTAELGDRDSLQIGVRFTYDAGDPTKETNGNPPNGAFWEDDKQFGENLAVRRSLSIPATATGMHVVFVYTDIVSSMWDVPAVISSWTGTKGADGEWTFQDDPLSNDLIGVYEPNNYDLPKDAADRERLADAVHDHVNEKTGYNVVRRGPKTWPDGSDGPGNNASNGRADTGYDLRDPGE